MRQILCWVLEHAEKLGGIATAGTLVVAIGTLVVAICALRFARKQISTARHTQREATAKDIYRDYLKLALDNPRLANPTEFVGGEGWKHAGEWKRDERYRWFVAFMMNSCDEIVSSRLGENWHNTVLMDLKMHKDYLASPEFTEDGGWDLYSLKLKSIGLEALNNGPDAAGVR